MQSYGNEDFDELQSQSMLHNLSMIRDVLNASENGYLLKFPPAPPSPPPPPPPTHLSQLPARINTKLRFIPTACMTSQTEIMYGNGA